MSPTAEALRAEEELPEHSEGSGLFGRPRRTPQTCTAAALTAALVALLAALTLLQLSAPGPAHRALRRSVASLTEMDSLLAAHGPALREQADASPDQPLSLPDYPLEVSLSPEEVRQPPAEVRDALRDRSAELVYEDGPSAFREEGQSGGTSRLSVEGAVRTGLDLLTASSHDGLRVATLALALLCGALSGALVLLARGYRGLTALGATVAAASLLFLLLAVVVRLALFLAGVAADDYITTQLLDLTEDAAWVPLRDGLALGGLGLALLVLGMVGHRLNEGTFQK
jgi:hypothetical protein